MEAKGSFSSENKDNMHQGFDIITFNASLGTVVEHRSLGHPWDSKNRPKSLIIVTQVNTTMLRAHIFLRWLSFMQDEAERDLHFTYCSGHCGSKMARGIKRVWI